MMTKLVNLLKFFFFYYLVGSSGKKFDVGNEKVDTKAKLKL